MQDNDQNPSDPTLAMTFVEDGITAFDVQYWTGSAWATVPNGSVTGNNKVWRQFTFSAITTTKVRVLVNNALNTRSRVVELEAWGTSNASPNQALAANGAVASASSTTPNSQFPGYNFLPGVANDGDRKSGVNFWRDDTANTYPDWLQIDFSGTKVISEIDVFTIQDNDQNPSDPTLGMTFIEDGITSFEVQYWTGSAWLTVPGGSVTGNNKVWRQFTFSPIATGKIRVLVNNALNGRSRIVELEAY
jgi:F5/8 type C domain-containing protein